MKVSCILKGSIHSLPKEVKDIFPCIREEEVFCPRGDSYLEDIDLFVNKAIQNNSDLILTVGGDGIASYVASSLIEKRAQITILGYPMGTSNVGPIVRKKEEFNSGFESLKIKELDALEVSSCGSVLGYAFNDVVIAETLLGTVDGKTVNISAEALYKRGKSEVMRPTSNLFTPLSTLLYNGEEIDICEKEECRQIVFSPLQKEKESSVFYGRAIFGPLMSASSLSHPAALTISKDILVDSDENSWCKKGVGDAKVIVFDENDSIEISGIKEEMFVVLDGNPYPIKKGELAVRVIPRAIKSYQKEV